MQGIAVRMSTKYQVVIPKPVREALGLGPQDGLLFVIEGETVMLRPQPDSFAQALRGLHRDLWPDPDTWLEEERSSWA